MLLLRYDPLRMVHEAVKAAATGRGAASGNRMAVACGFARIAGLTLNNGFLSVIAT
jgi:hypothetical protein